MEQIAFETRRKTEEHMLIVMDKSTHEEHLSQPIQINNKQFKFSITSLTGYNGIFNVTIRNDKFHFTVSIKDDDFSQITITQGVYELESLDKEINRNIFEERFFTESNYPFFNKVEILNLRFYHKKIQYHRQSNCFYSRW